MNTLAYGWKDARPTGAHQYVLPKILSLIPAGTRRVVDVGCGNGYLAAKLAERGLEVIGVEPSQDGIDQCRSSYASIRFERASIDADLRPLIGQDFDVVVATEVIEHLPAPRNLLRNGLRLLRPGGTMLLSTPYHGYLKNLALSLAGAWDRHFTVGWDGGHIKFFSPRTLRTMALECGFESVRFEYAGRAPWLWKSMFAIATKRP